MLELDTVATPLEKVMAVVEPKTIAVPEALVTVGLFELMDVAPPKVRLLEPV